VEVKTGDGVVTVRGEVDRVTIDQVVKAIEKVGGVVRLELEQVTFLDSSGLQGILVAQQTARSRGVDVILCRPSHVVSRILEITGLHEAFVIEG
jgi:anti-sigma B factor antagonist